jgi:hypothetical protein
MMTVIFGVSKPERMQRLERAMLAYCAVTESPSFLGVGILSTAPRGRWLPILKLARTAAAVDAIVLEEIAERRRTGSRSHDCLTMFLELNEQEGPRSCCPRATELMSRRARCPGEALAGVAQHEFAKFVRSAREGRLRTCSPRSVAACAWALRSAASYQRSSAKSPARRPPAGT